MSSEAFQYSEALLAQHKGFDRQQMKRVRDADLVEDRDWKKIRGEIVYCTTGLSRLWKGLRERPPRFDLTECIVPLQKKNGAEPVRQGPIPLGSKELPMPRTFTIRQIPLNPRTVVAADESGKKELVDVGNNATLVVGDEIQVAEHRSQPGIWRILGALPRSRRRIGGKPV